MIEQWAAHGPRHLTEPGTSGLVEVRILLAHIPIQLAEHVSGLEPVDGNGKRQQMLAHCQAYWVLRACKSDLSVG